jgi:hypothetical protein
MENIKTFESFNDPNKKDVIGITLSAYLTKSESFSMRKKKEKDLIKTMVGKDYTKEQYTKDNEGNYLIKTTDPEIKEIFVPAKFVYEKFK